MRLAVFIVRMRTTTIHTKFWSENWKERDVLKELGADERSCVCGGGGEGGGESWTEVICCRIWARDGLY
jgi:hypothetical protein